MRSFTRVVLPIAIIIALVGGLSYFMQYTPPAPDQPAVKSSAAVDLPSLLFLQQSAEWDPVDSNYAQEFELNHKGHYDFWVANPYPTPVSIVLREKSCVCASVELGIVDAGAEAEFLQTAIGAGLTPRKLFGDKGLNRAALTPLAERVQWSQVNVNDSPVTIPAANPKYGIRLALFRLNWNSKTVGPMRLTAVLNYTGGDPKPAEKPLEAKIVVVPPVQIVPSMVALGDIKNGEEKKWTFVLWSATRNEFPCVLPSLPNDPCIVFDPPRLLNHEEQLAATVLLPRQYPDMPPTRVKCGYFVTCKVHERLGDQMLELGPLARRFVFNAGTEFEASSTLSASVRGDIRLSGARDDDDRIALGDFRGDRPLTRTFLLNSARANLKVKLASFSPDSIKVSLKERSGVGGGWELRLEIPPNSVSGPFPIGSSIILETIESQPRRMRIPISGVAFVP